MESGTGDIVKWALGSTDADGCFKLSIRTSIRLLVRIESLQENMQPRAELGAGCCNYAQKVGDSRGANKLAAACRCPLSSTWNAALN